MQAAVVPFWERCSFPQVIVQFPADGWVPQAVQGWASIWRTRSRAEHPTLRPTYPACTPAHPAGRSFRIARFTRWQFVQNIPQMLPQQVIGHGFMRWNDFIIFDKVAPAPNYFSSGWQLQRKRPRVSCLNFLGWRYQRFAI